jgi:hypothetical protein
MEDKKLKNIMNDPMFNISDKEKDLFDIPSGMKKVIAKKKPEYVAQRQPCEDFDKYEPLFANVNEELKEGKRNLIQSPKTYDLSEGHFYIVSGQTVYLERTFELKKNSVGSLDGRTRCIYEDGTESDIMLQTLRRNILTDGYIVSETQDETDKKFFNNDDINEKDKLTGNVYVLKSLSSNPAIENQKELYKIGFSTDMVEIRTANAEHEPTYLMAPVKIVEYFDMYNMNSQKFENIVHQVLDGVRFHTKVYDDNGIMHEPKEWFIVPLNVIETIVRRIQNGTIVDYAYNAEIQCLQKVVKKHVSTYDATGLKVLTLNIKKVFFEEIMKGEKTEEYRELKQTTINRFTYIDESDGKRHLKWYDVIRFYVGYHRDRESALVQIKDINYDKDSNAVIFSLGNILECLR